MSGTYKRHMHATHGALGAAGWDLEEWTVAQAYPDPRPAYVPPDAEKHHGYIGEDGVQRVVYQRTAPMSAGRCKSPRCTGGAR